MMKKEPKKLTLHRETLRALEDNRLGRVRGAGRTENTCDNTGCLECPATFTDGCW